MDMLSKGCTVRQGLGGGVPTRSVAGRGGDNAEASLENSLLRYLHAPSGPAFTRAGITRARRPATVPRVLELAASKAADCTHAARPAARLPGRRDGTGCSSQLVFYPPKDKKVGHHGVGRYKCLGGYDSSEGYTTCRFKLVHRRTLPGRPPAVAVQIGRCDSQGAGCGRGCDEGALAARTP
eukprot:scaffold22315_cov50-Phaeocystis_antarctica.AAC.4